MYKKPLFWLLVLVVVYTTPLGIVQRSGRAHTTSGIQELPDSDVIIVFGTLVANNEVSPLLKERLEAGRAILEAGKSKKIVVSNTKAASNVMAEYLYAVGVSPERVELDEQAETTPDTCRFEREQHTEGRTAIFVSQGFHLSRLLYQCKKVGVEGVAFPAESLDTIDRSHTSFFERFSIRFERYMREAGLTWLAVLGIYS